jgi:hypothetical protein
VVTVEFCGLERMEVLKGDGLEVVEAVCFVVESGGLQMVWNLGEIDR